MITIFRKIFCQIARRRAGSGIIQAITLDLPLPDDMEEE